MEEGEKSPNVYRLYNFGELDLNYPEIVRRSTLILRSVNRLTRAYSPIYEAYWRNYISASERQGLLPALEKIEKYEAECLEYIAMIDAALEKAAELEAEKTTK